MKPTYPTMRTDFEFDNQRIPVKRSSWIGYSTGHAKRGYWISWQMPDETHVSLGRVIGRVTCYGGEIKGEDNGRGLWIMVAALSTDGTCVHMRWIRPDWVRSSQPRLPVDALEFLMGEWKDPQAICDRMHRGFLCKEI